jgi:glycosyltransferase 2 family protein
MQQPESIPPQTEPGITEPSPKKNKTWTLVKILISGVLLVFLVTQVKWQTFFAILTSVSLIYMLYPFFAYYINVALSVIKWQSLLKYQDVKDKFIRLYAIYLTGAFYNNFLPSTIGGDGYRFLEMRSRHPGKSEPIFSSILLERGFGYLTLLLINLLLSVWFWQFISTQTWLMLIEAALAAGLVMLALLWLYRDRLAAIILKHASLQRSSIVTKLFQFLKFLEIRDWKVIAVSFATSFLFVLISGVWLAVYYWSVGASVNWLYAMYVSTLVNIVGALPITLNGLGIVELLQVRMMGMVGVPIETVLVVSLMTRVLLILFSLPGGLLSFL